VMANKRDSQGRGPQLHTTERQAGDRSNVHLLDRPG
jgi:hypothetical protein